jgi:hypothetical protein
MTAETEAGTATVAAPGETTAAGDWRNDVPLRPLVDDELEARFALALGDRAVAVVGTTVQPGDTLLEHLRDRRIEEVTMPAEPGVDAHADPSSGGRWASRSSTGRLGRGATNEGELLSLVPGQVDRWRIVTGDQRDPVLSPVAGRVVAVRPGGEVRLKPAGRAIRGAFAAGSPSHGRLELATDPFGDLRPGGIDVGRAGSILVVGARIDAEALTRARAMGVRGIVVASLPGKDLRDFRASERRQRAALHPTQPFGVLVLDGTMRRQIPTPIASLLERLAGREVSLLVDPPALVFEAADDDLPVIDPDYVRVRSGPSAGAEGRLVAPAGLRRFERGVQLEAAMVSIGGRAPVAIPIGDLERIG